MEVGALIHSRREQRAHDATARCFFCAVDGRAALRARNLRGLLIGRRDGRWYVRVRPSARPSSGVYATSEPDPSVNPFADLGGEA